MFEIDESRKVMNLTDNHAASAASTPPVAAPAVYENGPDGMPRVKRLPHAVMDCIIKNSLFRYLGSALEGEDRERLYGLMHDTADEVLARVPRWPADNAAAADAGGQNE
jgi:hypothetical protein